MKNNLTPKNQAQKKEKAKDAGASMTFKNVLSEQSNSNSYFQKSKLPLKRIGKKQCDALRREIAEAGLMLGSAAGYAQLETLPKVLRYLGSRGLGTVEGEALGYRRIATRIQDLEVEGYGFIVKRENVVTDDCLLHPSMARYFLASEKPSL
jgi:hypothetical protein